MSRIAAVLLTLAFAASASAQSTAGFSGGTISGPSPRPPNIIIFDIDDIGIESYPQLGSLWVNEPTDTVLINAEHTAIHGDSYDAPVAADFPNLTRLLALGVSFEGMWGNKMCVGGRTALRTGNPNGWIDPSLTLRQTIDRSPKRQIQDDTNQAYRIYHYGKDFMGGPRDQDDNGNLSSGQTPTGSGGPTNNRQLGTQINSPGWWFASTIPVRGMLTDNGDESYAAAPSVLAPQDDPDLYLGGSGGTQPMMNQDDWGVEYMFEYITSLYPGTVLGEPLPQSFWAQQTGQPFLATLGLHYNHAGSGNHCPLQTDGGRIYPSPGKIAEMGSTNDPANGGTHRTYASSFFSDPDIATLHEDYSTDGKDWWPAGFSCQMDQLRWIDQQLGKTLDWLGPEGLKNTLIIFMGDNGTIDSNLTKREHLRAPHIGGGGFGQDLTTPDAVGSFYIDDDGTGWNSCGLTVYGPFCGKGSNHETGINVPFIVAGGPVADHLRGTTSPARLQFADISETLVQLVTPGKETTYDGRDFGNLFGGGPAPDLGPTYTGWQGGGAFVLQPDEQGRIYRIWRNYAHTLADHCDYLQDLSRADYWTDLRDDPTAQAAWAELDALARTAIDFPEGTVDMDMALEGRGNVVCGP